MYNINELSEDTQAIAIARHDEFYVNKDFVSGKEFIIVNSVAVEFESVKEAVKAAKAAQKPVEAAQEAHAPEAPHKPHAKAPKRVKDLAPAPELAPTLEVPAPEVKVEEVKEEGAAA